MSLTSFDAVFFTAGFLVPGFVWSTVLSLVLPRRRDAAEIRFLGFLTLSCINHGIWSWALVLIFRTGFLERHPACSAFWLFVILFVSPVGLGILTAYLQQNEWVGAWLSRLGFRTIHPAPTAWDWHFSRLKPYWVLVTRKDGSQVYGLFHARSFAGDDPEHRDLYLEAVFRPVETGEWAPVEDTAGALIMPEEIAVVEFRKMEEVDYGDQRAQI